MSQLGEFVIKDMRKRIRLGYGATRNGGSRQKLKALSPSYVEQRRFKLGFWTNRLGNKVPIKTVGINRQTARNNKAYLKRNNPKLDGTTSPKKSNLTRTGRMLRSMGFIYTNRRLILGFKTTESGKKAAFVSKERPFFFLTSSEEKRATKFLQKRFDQLISRNIRKNF